MTSEIKSPNNKLRKLHANVLMWRRPSAGISTCHGFLNDEDFRFAADCERMRVDRNRSVLSLLLVRLRVQNSEDLAFFARILEGRLRVTDTPGLLKDGRVAILLPDTPAEGAWKVAEDISEVYPPGPGRPECDVIVYPDSRLEDSMELGNSSDAEGATEEDEVTPHHKNDRVARTNELFFVKDQPSWKRLLDVLGGIAGLICSLPILAVAATIVKTTSSGPAFFSQQREGLGGKRFVMWKLRTMETGADAKKSQLREHSVQDGPAFKMVNDPRITTVGRFLRWTSMDELPQFWNVLKGDMSLVGPRPLPTEESVACENWQRRRLHVKPGMTCTWQVSERGNVSFDEWTRMDLRYAKKTSFFQDVKLLLLTLPSLIFNKGVR